MAHMLCEKTVMRGAMPVAHGPFELYNKEFVQKCYLDECLLQTKDIWILRAYLQTPQNQLATTHIPTLESFALHTIDQGTVNTFRALNLDGYFFLPAWGPDIQRAYEVIHTYDPMTGYIKVTDFDGAQVKIPLTAELIKRALNFGDALLFTETRFTKEINKETSDYAKPKFSQLKHQSIRTALQLFTQHFKLCYPQKFTKPETRIARQFTLAALGSPEARKDFSDFICKEIKNARSYKAKRGPYLGGVLALTRIAYMGLGRIDKLPPPLATTEELAWKFIRSSHYRPDIPRSPSPASDQDDESNDEDDEEGRDDDRRRTEIEFRTNGSRRADPEEQEVCRKLSNETRKERGEGLYLETLNPLKDFPVFREPVQVYIDIPMYANAERIDVIKLDEPSLDDLYQQEEEERLRRQAIEQANFQRQAEEQAEIKRRLEAQQLAVEEDIRKQQLEAQRREQEGFFKLAEIKRKQEAQKLKEQQLAVEENMRKQQVEAQRMEEERLFHLVNMKRKQEAWHAREWQLVVEENFRKQQVDAHRREEDRLFKKIQEAQQLREQQLAVEEDIRRQHVEAQKREAERLLKWKQEALQLRQQQLAGKDDYGKQQVEAQRKEEERLLELAQEEQRQREEQKQDDFRKQRLEAQKREERLLKHALEEQRQREELAEKDDFGKQQVEAQRREEERLLKLAQEEQRQREESERCARKHLEVQRKLQEEEEARRTEEEKRQKKNRIRLLLRQHLRRLVQQRTSGVEESIKQKIPSPELPVEVEAVASAHTVAPSEVEKMDVDGPPKESPPKKRRVDLLSPNGRKRVHFSEDATTDTILINTSHEVHVEQDQLRKEVREGMKQIFSNIGTNVFQQFKVPQGQEDKEKIHPKVARLLNKTVEAVGKPVPGTALAKCFSEGAVDLCTTSLFENIFQMQAIVQIRETTLNRMIAALQQQLEETVIAVAKESRGKDEQIKMTALALEKLAKMQAEKDELGKKVEALLMEVHVDEAKLAALIHELKVLQAQKESLQKHLRVLRRELQATKATMSQFRALMLEKSSETVLARDKVSLANGCWQQILEDRMALNDISNEVNGMTVEADLEAQKAIEQVWKENMALKQIIEELESKLQVQSQPSSQVGKIPSRETGHSCQEEFQPKQTSSTVRQKVESDPKSETKNGVATEAHVRAPMVSPEHSDYELYKLARGHGAVKPLDKSLYMLPKALLMVLCEMQLKEWDEANPENTRGGYHRLTSETSQSADTLEGQPPWRLQWFKRHPEHLDYYLQCPREQRVSGTFCPVPRRHTWKEFKKIHASNPEALNYPSLPETEEGQELTEEWFVSKIDAIEKEYEGIPDPTILMLLKILHMLKVCIEGFADIKPQTNWHALDFFGAGLAFTFGLGPMECQLYGYFARLQYLPAHYLNTFEEAFVTNFFKHGASFVLGPLPYPVHQRWFAQQMFHKAFSGAFRLKRNFEQENRYNKIQSALRLRRRLAVELGMPQPSKRRNFQGKRQQELRRQKLQNR